ncbi:hypothetical protein IW261DRAFT_1644243 [Armillaria novae-zelandiae]|uniref:Uncharacterized protein n=1 Tax=Armillaria novae-zelandiae TaxID=153914 RepID=A0AA39TAA9_9AGAR|nr:hypothetical protein IW261DRAFT_1644243 [Armillaria novae-zelandiae]
MSHDPSDPSAYPTSSPSSAPSANTYNEHIDPWHLLTLELHFSPIVRILVQPVCDYIVSHAFPIGFAVSLCLVRGQTTNATCVSSYGWANNTLGQSPCLVASYLETACLNTSAFLVPALPDGSHYTGPGTAQVNLCNCNTITYSLISACADCQNRQYLNWGNWTANCAVVAIGLFPYPTPAGTSIPQWAYININSSTALYNPVEAEDGVPTVSLLTSFSTASTTTSSTSPSSAATTSTSATVSPTVTTSSGSNVGAIAGGVVGGIAFLIGAAMLALFSRVLQRRRKAHAAARFADMVNHVDTSHVGPLLKQESSTDRRGHAEHSRENSQAEEMKELVRTTSAGRYMILFEITAREIQTLITFF